MTIDERIRALTESVELLASFHRDTEAAMQKLDEKLTAQIAALTRQVSEFATQTDTIRQLVLIHKSRLRKIEGHP